jgi:hypothetical protein
MDIEMSTEMNTVTNIEEQHVHKRLKHVPERSRSQVMSEFMRTVVNKWYIVFGGAVRDSLRGIEPNDIDIYIECRRPNRVEQAIANFINELNEYSFEPLIEGMDVENIDWTAYKDFDGNQHNCPAVVRHYLVSRDGVSFKVDLVLSKYEPCFGHLDCIVNGLYYHRTYDSPSTVMKISFVRNSGNKKLEDLFSSDHDDKLVELAVRLINEGRAGILPNCDQHRIDKMQQKGYNVDLSLL